MDYKSITTEELEQMIRQKGQKMERRSVNLANATYMEKWNNGKSNKGRTPV